MVNLGDARQSTPTVSKNLNPEWNVCFDLPIDGIQSDLLEAVCWDRDRFGKDYLGGFDVVVEDIFANGQTVQEVSDVKVAADFQADSLKPRWYRLESRRKGEQKKGAEISGEVQLQFSLADTQDLSARPHEILQKMATLLAMSPEDESDGDEDLAGLDNLDLEDEDDDEIDEKNPETSDETDDPTKPAKAAKEKRKRTLRMKRLKKRAKARAYEFTGGTDVVGIVFLEICKITDLPPERNSKWVAMICSPNPCSPAQ